MNNKIVLLVPFLLVLALLTACGGAETYTPESASPSEAPTTSPEPTKKPTAKPQETVETNQVSIDEIQNIEWGWSSLVETQPTNQSVEPDPQNYTLVLWEDDSYDFKADCNVGGGAYQVDGSDITLQPGVTTLAECGPDSLYNQYLKLLDRVESFEVRADILILNLQNDVGEMQFENGGVAEKPEAPETCNTGIDPVSVTVNIVGLPYAYQPSCIPGTPYEDDETPAPTGLPDHIQVNFSQVDEEEQISEAIIYIIPVADYKQLWEEAGDETVSTSIESLQDLLREKLEPVPTSDIPILPMEQVTGDSDLQVQGAYMDVTTGAGVRFVTRFSEDPNPVASDNPALFYTFQGFSSDGVYLITYFHPVTTEVLPSSQDVPDEEQEQVDTDYDGYIEEKTEELNATQPSDWAPDLTSLDALIGSLEYEKVQEEVTSPPPRMTNINWQWGELIDTNPSTQPVIPDPQNYSLVLLPDGSLTYVADCNSGGGTYTISGNSISIRLEESTLADCGTTSLSSLYLTLLETVETYSLEANSLAFGLADEAGRMVFYYGGMAINPSPPKTGMPTATTLEVINVRNGPGTQYLSYGVVDQGTTFEVTGISEDGDWWVVKVPIEVAPDEQGWVTEEYVKTVNTEGVSVVPTPPLEEVQVPKPISSAPSATIVQSTNVYGGPGTEYSNYGVMRIGTIAEVVGVSEDGAWWVIKLPEDTAPDGQGWLNAGYIDVANAANVPVIPTPTTP